MQNYNVIEVKDVHKRYKNYFDKSNSLKEKVLNRERNKFEEHWVLNGISFEVKKGEAIGLVGCNGCGKSTTLKLLTKIIYPDKGSIEIRGRVSSLLELGAGFHPDLSGYENIYLNAAVFGLSRKEIDKRVDEIIRFSELKEYINNPIRTYSSGMYMKLAFSVAINVDADILLIDEILGVGDVSFQKKCFEKLLEIKERGTSLVIVSHSTDQIERICDKSIWLSNGVIKQVGNPKEVHENYLREMEDSRLIRKKAEEEDRRLQLEAKEKAKENVKAERLKSKKKRAEKRKLIEQNQSQTKEGEIQEKEAFESKMQEELIKKAEIERDKQSKIGEQFSMDNLPIEVARVQFFKREASRLELVVTEKNFEIDRLNSVIRQKELELERTVNSKNIEIQRLETVILEKDDEIDRLNDVILELT